MMGKTLNQQKSGGLSLEEKHSPATGCMWGLLHHLQHNRWNQAKKRLTITRKPHNKTRRILLDEESNTTTTTITCNAQETHVNSSVDLLNLRKEVFLKVLHDPASSSSLSHSHRRRGAPSLNKSVSFPSSARTDNDDNADRSNNNNNKKQQQLVVAEVDDNGNDSFVVVKRFKNLREKIKHVIRDKKKDKYRILMDSVQHIIPYGQHSSRPKEDYCNNNNNNNNNKKLHKRTTSSFDESSGRRYNHLLDSIGSNNKEANCKDLRHNIVINPRRFERILSLPNLRRPPCSEDSSKASSSSSPQAGPAEDKPHDVAPPCVLESASQENLIELAGSTFDDSGDSKPWETAASHDSGPRLLDLDLVSEKEFYCDQEHDEPGPMPVSQDENFHNENESSSSGGHDPTSSMKNEAEFCYVRDMLELAGFTRDELLGKWHSTGHPMLFDEVEGASTPCDHLLLFDLINEVLLDIHERSTFYCWPAPLTSPSRMHRMPTGYRVLEEVWGEIGWLLSWRPELDQSIDDSVRRDLGKADRWMSIC